MKELQKIAIVGAGSWGTALSMVAAESGRDVVLWTQDKTQAELLASTRRNPFLLDAAPLLAENIMPTSDLNQVLDADLVLIVVPSVAMRSVASTLQNAELRPDAILVSCTKGIEQGTHCRMTQILKEYLPSNKIGALSGPNHAEDICMGLPSATLIGFEEQDYADRVQRALSTGKFRVYTSNDVTSMELGGTIKNVFAIGAGLCVGLKIGDNALAALVTRGLAEMTRIGSLYGGNKETFMGLSGMGDLVVTCYSSHSRNQRVGQSLARGISLQETLDSLKMVAEGVPNTRSIYEMAREVGARTPLIDAVYSVLYEGKAPLSALNELMNRDPRPEHD
ncbi:NAD(P)H-dependent glycerol-3-phosphate dehydrogenase [Akkermansia sp. N21116]|jgi:glycerol-3-phosphate dehydrogenase (NAD(P)+)|uniref:NAD(P)H-dependent glycerol-3-phosphate dehydrogenase n=1 Tax=Akkermansia sp. N21116 TaxID=3040764 RepID=UPI00244EEF0F|nr:NAD(P)H-dependent glycerol-3-phosphate dehydrogenase [Akkermansia sp. N21116]WPX40515.1 NAD(P)H-dependent glycerol-3-phosphate dehydrogenase [Akkermansia sp. N21116]